MPIHLLQGDITQQQVDVMVNAANTSLLGGGGVDGAIHQAGGPAILADCHDIRARQGGCGVGEAVMTTAGKLPAKKVIHTVGPVWHGGDLNEAENLRSCYWNSLELATAHGYVSIAFPNISTGVYRFPKRPAAEIAIATVREYLSKTELDVIFVCFEADNWEVYRKLLAEE